MPARAKQQTDGGDMQRFTVSPSIIKHLIESQAGSVEKAVLEAVMNAIDAKATRCDIAFDGNKSVVIEDDGHGFRSREDIQKHFAVFGFDHDTDEERAHDREIGRFGLGRGQIMAFAATVWETNRWRMDVDIRGKAKLAFRLREARRVLYDGCRITARLYDPLTNVAKQATIDEIKRQTLYAPVEVWIDGKQVNKGTDGTNWTETTRDFYFLERPNATRGVDVYNKGVFVRRYPHYRMGVSGDLVSRRNFNLNMARNDVLQSTCPLWKKAVKLMGKYGQKRQGSGRLDADDRMAIIANLLAGEYDPDDWSNKSLIKTINGRHVAPTSLSRHARGAGVERGTVVVPPAKDSQVGETIHRQHKAAVVSPDVLEWFGADDIHEFVARFNQVWPTWEITAGDFDELAGLYSSSHAVVPKHELSKAEKAIAAALTTMSRRMAHSLWYSGDYQQFAHVTRHRQIARDVELGASDVAQAWTDGESYIVFDRVQAAAWARQGLDGFAAAASVMLHEYLHTEPDSKNHVHSREFYETFEAVMCTGFELFDIVSKSYREFIKHRDKLGLKMAKADAKRLDTLDEIDGKAPEQDELEQRRAVTRPKAAGLKQVDWVAEFDSGTLVGCWAELVTRSARYRTKRLGSKAALQSEVRSVLSYHKTAGLWPKSVTAI